MGAKRPENYPYYSGSLYGFQCWDLKSWYPGFFSSTGFEIQVPGILFQSSFFFTSTIKLNWHKNEMCINMYASMCMNMSAYKKWPNSAVKIVLKPRYPGFLCMAHPPKDAGTTWLNMFPPLINFLKKGISSIVFLGDCSKIPHLFFRGGNMFSQVVSELEGDGNCFFKTQKHQNFWVGS